MSGFNFFIDASGFFWTIQNLFKIDHVAKIMFTKNLKKIEPNEV